MFQETMEAMRIMGIPEEEQIGTGLALLRVREGRPEAGRHVLLAMRAADGPGNRFLLSRTLGEPVAAGRKASSVRDMGPQVRVPGLLGSPWRLCGGNSTGACLPRVWVHCCSPCHCPK